MAVGVAGIIWFLALPALKAFSADDLEAAGAPGCGRSPDTEPVRAMGTGGSDPEQ
jgi:hypothetical protein